MDVRLLITGFRPINLYRVCVFAPGITESWIKDYSSRQDCISELRCIDLLTPEEADEALASDFDTKERILIAHSNADSGTLQESGFIKQVLDLPN